MTFDEALEAGRALGTDLVVAEREDTVGPMVAAALGVPWARFLLGADLPPEVSGAIADSAEERYAARGLKVKPPAVLDPWPAELQPPGWRPASHRVIVRPEPHAGPDPGDAGAVAPPTGRPRVLVTPGTIADDAEAVAALVGSLVDLDVDLVLTGHHGRPWPLDVGPGRVRQVGFVPLARLLEGIDAAVVAGGSGTDVGALSRAVPLVVCPLVFDQTPNAERAAETGAAVVAARPEEVGSAVEAVLADPAVRAAARRMAARIAAMDPPERARLRVLELARRQSAPPVQSPSIGTEQKRNRAIYDGCRTGRRRFDPAPAGVRRSRSRPGLRRSRAVEGSDPDRLERPEGGFEAVGPPLRRTTAGVDQIPLGH